MYTLEEQTVSEAASYYLGALKDLNCCKMRPDTVLSASLDEGPSFHVRKRLANTTGCVTSVVGAPLSASTSTTR